MFLLASSAMAGLFLCPRLKPPSLLTVDGVLVIGGRCGSRGRAGWTTTNIVTATSLSWLDVTGGKGCIVRLISMILQTEHAAGAAL